MQLFPTLIRYTTAIIQIRTLRQHYKILIIPVTEWTRICDLYAETKTKGSKSTDQM